MPGAEVWMSSRTPNHTTMAELASWGDGTAKCLVPTCGQFSDCLVRQPAGGSLFLSFSLLGCLPAWPAALR
jgi:hypothetical protein